MSPDATHVSSTYRSRESTSPLGSLFQNWTLSIMTFFLIFNLNDSWQKLRTSSSPITGYLGAKTICHLVTPSFQVIVERKKSSSKPFSRPNNPHSLSFCSSNLCSTLRIWSSPSVSLLYWGVKSEPRNWGVPSPLLSAKDLSFYSANNLS